MLRNLGWALLACIVGCGSGEEGVECVQDSDCPPGRYCQLAGVCAFDCTFDRDCNQGERCDPRGRCERDCEPTNAGIEDCDGIDNDCDGETDEELAGEDCFQENQLGRCSGRDFCYAGAWTCDAPVPQEERCDQVDNDCDGDTDEDISDRECQHENQFGRCTGTETCTAGAWVCDAAEPAAEECDGRDNDCDGMTDDDLDPGCPLDSGVCQGSQRTCQGEQGWTDCDYGADYQNPEAACDNRDNDCDGDTDEGLVRDPCHTENTNGRCDGVERCGSGDWLCDAPVPTEELCDRVDNDCDGQTDEGAPRIETCEVGAETTDGIDNNCDGQTDELGGCMVRVQHPGVDVLIDVYEATVFENQDCTGARYGETAVDYPAGWPPGDQPGTLTLYACSLPGMRPSRLITVYQARRACAAQGKRLCGKWEWARACGGDDQAQYPYGGAQYIPGACQDFTTGYLDTVESGSLSGCRTPTGVYDLSGNLWEWIEDPCEVMPDIASIQGGAYECVYNDGGTNVQCDMQDLSQQFWIWAYYSCQYPGEVWLCQEPEIPRPQIGFRCCRDPE